VVMEPVLAFVERWGRVGKVWEVRRPGRRWEPDCLRAMGPAVEMRRRSWGRGLVGRVWGGERSFCLALGDFVRLADSLNQCLREANCWKRGPWYFFRFF